MFLLAIVPFFSYLACMAVLGIPVFTIDYIRRRRKATSIRSGLRER